MQRIADLRVALIIVITLFLPDGSPFRVQAPAQKGQNNSTNTVACKPGFAPDLGEFILAQVKAKQRDHD